VALGKANEVTSLAATLPRSPRPRRLAFSVAPTASARATSARNTRWAHTSSPPARTSARTAAARRTANLFRPRRGPSLRRHQQGPRPRSCPTRPSPCVSIPSALGNDHHRKNSARSSGDFGEMLKKRRENQYEPDGRLKSSSSSWPTRNTARRKRAADELLSHRGRSRSRSNCELKPRGRGAGCDSEASRTPTRWKASRRAAASSGNPATRRDGLDAHPRAAPEFVQENNIRVFNPAGFEIAPRRTNQPELQLRCRAIRSSARSSRFTLPKDNAVTEEHSSPPSPPVREKIARFGDRW